MGICNELAITSH